MSANKRINKVLVKVNRYAITSLISIRIQAYRYLVHEMWKEALILVESTYLLLLLLLHLYLLLRECLPSP